MDPEHPLTEMVVRELTSLRDQLEECEEEKALFRRKIESLTCHLTDTTGELEHRMTLFADATAQVERLEAQAAEASRTLLSREMQIHELTKEKQALTALLGTREKEAAHWEREYLAAKEEITRCTRARERMREERDEKATEVAAWQAKMQVTVQSMEEMQRQLAELRSREAGQANAAAERQREMATIEKRWQAKVDKRDKALVRLERELEALRAQQTQVEDAQRGLLEREAEWRSAETTTRMESRRQLVALEGDLERAKAALGKAQVSEMLLQRELQRLREELLLSESQRQTDARRHEQELRGRAKEMAFVWQKYVEAMCPAATPTSSSSRGGVR